jgi:hypothetical protein
MMTATQVSAVDEQRPLAQAGQPGGITTVVTAQWVQQHGQPTPGGGQLLLQSSGAGVGCLEGDGGADRSASQTGRGRKQQPQALRPAKHS